MQSGISYAAMNISITEKLEVVIQEKGWSEAEAARELGTSQPTINRYRNGKRKRVEFEVGLKIHELYSEIVDSNKAA